MAASGRLSLALASPPATGDLMRTLAAITAAAVALAGAAQAQTPQPAAKPTPPVLPRLFVQAGYSQPAIPASACKHVSPAETQCVLPAMTAGRYFAGAAGVSTAVADGAEQRIAFVLGDQHCTATYAPDPKAPWAVGAKRRFYAGCIFTVVTDRPIALTAVYFDAKATKDPAGPTLTVTPEPWTGALSSVPVTITP
jgi:hypothetical protein